MFDLYEVLCTQLEFTLLKRLKVMDALGILLIYIMLFSFNFILLYT